MSEIRDKARALLDANLPEGKIITSNGPTAAKYTEMTGLTHQKLTDNWAGGGIMTGCNGFTGWYGTRMGSKIYIGGFDLKGLAAKAGKADAWIKSTPANRPKYGDILRHASFHVDVALDFDGDILIRAAAGQGGSKVGCDIIKRVRSKEAYDLKKLQGWIDLDIYLGDGASAPAPAPGWLEGWWELKDGLDSYYDHFFRSGIVQFTRTRPATLYCPNFPDNYSGRFTMGAFNKITIVWNVAEFPRELLVPDGLDQPPALKVSLPDQPGAPFTATKMS